jgi:hypothetical protein
MKPTVGRIVHYYGLDDKGPYAALVVATEPLVLLAFYPDGHANRLENPPEDASHSPGSWSWPPVVR